MHKEYPTKITNRSQKEKNHKIVIFSVSENGVRVSVPLASTCSGIGKRIGKIYTEGTSAACLGLYLNIAVLQCNDFSRQVQTDTDPLAVVDLRFPVKSLKNSPLTFRGNPLSIIGNADLRKDFLTADRDIHLSAFPGIFYTVVQYVKEGFSSPLSVMAYRKILITIHTDLNLLGLRPGNHSSHGFGQGLKNCCRLLSDLDSSCLQPDIFTIL